MIFLISLIKKKTNPTLALITSFHYVKNFLPLALYSDIETYGYGWLESNLKEFINCWIILYAESFEFKRSVVNTPNPDPK